MTLGEKIRETRRKCGLSQEQLAEKLSVSRSAVAKWETDKGLPDVGNLKILARLLNVSVDYLLDEGEQQEQAVLRESYDLASYGRGCKKLKKDRLVREKFPDAKIYTLLARPERATVEGSIDDTIGCMSAAPLGASDARCGIKNRDKEFYLVERPDRRYVVMVADGFMETRPLEDSMDPDRFTLEGWSFIRCSYAHGI